MSGPANAGNIVIGVIEPSDAETLAQNGVSPTVIGLTADDWNDRALIEELDGADLIIMPPSEAEFDESIPVRQIVRDAAKALAPHCASVRIAGSWAWSTPGDILHGALTVAQWSKGNGKNLGRWTPIMIDDCEPSSAAEYLIKSVLPARGIAVGFGESGCGKTYMLSDMAFHVAEGEDWRGYRTQRRGVMWVAAEAPEGMRKRLFALRQRKRHPDRPTPFAMFPVTPDLRTTDADRRAFVEAVSETALAMDVPVGLIVIDTLAQTLNGGSDVAMEDMGAVLANARAIEAATGALVLLIHHSGHSEKDRMRGHSSLHAAADAVFGIKADPETKLRTLQLVKLKDGESGACWHFELEQIDLGTDDDGDRITTCVVRHRDDVAIQPTRPSRRAKTQGEMDRGFVLQALNDLSVVRNGSGLVTPVTRDALRDACYARGFHGDSNAGARRVAFSRAISSLFDDGAISERDGVVTLRQTP